jgi:hypothetical protein
MFTVKIYVGNLNYELISKLKREQENSVDTKTYDVSHWPELFF